MPAAMLNIKLLIVATLFVLLGFTSAARRCYQGYTQTGETTGIVEVECGDWDTCVVAYGMGGGDFDEWGERTAYGCGNCEDTDLGVVTMSCYDCGYDFCNVDDHVINGASDLSVVMSMLVSTVYYMLCA